jgi:YD repeat-containing protein
MGPILPRRLLEPPVHAPAVPGACDDCGGGSLLAARLHLFSGEFVESVEDLRIGGRGLDFVWARKYRSRTGSDTAQGHRWDFSYNVSVQASGDDLILANGDGRRDVFRRQPDGSFLREEMFHVGRRNPDHSITFLFPDRGRWNFFPLDGRPQAGRIQSIVDRNENALRFDYDERGRLATITDTLGRAIRVAYDAEGRIASITDFTGRQVRYSYYRNGEERGAAGDLKSVTRPAVTGTPNGNDFPQGKTTTYTYTKGFADARLNHLLLSITDAKGQTFLQNTYATDNPGAFDFGRLRRQVWGEKDAIEIAYVRQTPAKGGAVVTAIVNDAVGNVKEYLFDAGNRCLAVREYTGRARAGQPVTRTANRPNLENS